MGAAQHRASVYSAATSAIASRLHDDTDPNASRDMKLQSVVCTAA